ncbi:hypothetical protein [Micromonospora rosaria]|uniref:hypothetical protein n=1 Tax=Micromonospora rosaria TaxID=47874 RepID=UPI000A603E0A|nr:hypothetical protein [Micromonospora rosaria]
MSVDEAVDPFSVAIVARRVLSAHEAGRPCWRCTGDTIAGCPEARWFQDQVAAR